MLAFVVLLIGKDAVIEAAKDWDVPLGRGLLLTDARIDSKLAQSEQQLKEGLGQDLAAAEAAAARGARLADRVPAQIDQALRQRADDAILRFG